MATLTGGTLATTTLTLVQWTPGMSAADFATVALGVARDCGQPLGSVWGNPAGPLDSAGNKTNIPQPGAVDASGWLTLPGGRGRVRIYPGDSIAVDGFGNLFPIPSRALPKTLTASVTTTNSSANVTSSTDLRTLGWQNGTHVTGTNIPSGSVIGDLATDGKSFNLYAFSTGLKATATGSGSVTATAGTFTHS